MAAGKRKKAPPKKKAAKKKTAKRKPKPNPNALTTRKDQFGREVPPEFPAKNTRGRTRKVTIEEPPEDSRHKLRYLAGIFYTTSVDGCTVEDMMAVKQFSGLTERTLRYWMHEDKWVARRKQVMEEWRRRLEQRLGTELIQARRDQLGDLDEIWTQTMGEFRQENVVMRPRPNSFEGMVNAASKLAVVSDQLRTSVIEQVLPPEQQNQSQEGEAASGLLPDVSDEEYKEITLFLLRKRLAEAQERAADFLDKDDAEDEEEEGSEVLPE